MTLCRSHMLGGIGQLISEIQQCNNDCCHQKRFLWLKTDTGELTDDFQVDRIATRLVGGGEGRFSTSAEEIKPLELSKSL